MATTLTDYFPIGTAQVATNDDWLHISPYFGCLSGVGVYGEEVADEFEVFADSTGAQVKVRAGECFIKGVYGYHSSQQTLTLGGTAPTSGQSRIDVVVLRRDLTNLRIEMAVVNGDPATAGSEVAPALTASSTIYEIPLAHVQVDYPGTTIAAGDVTDARLYARPRGMAIGEYKQTATVSGPAGYLPCDGVAVSRVTYSELFSAIGTAYGVGDGSTTFNPPDKRGEVLMTTDDMGSGDAGRLSSGFNSVAAHYGSESGDLTVGELEDTSVATTGGGQDVVITVTSNAIQPSGLVYTWIAARPR